MTSVVSVPIIAGLPLTACQQIRALDSPGDSSAASTSKPATVEPLKGTAVSRVSLTARAAERIGIETTAVREAPVARSGRETLRKVVPYAAVLYDAHGDTWVYTSLEPRVFVRHPIAIDYIEGDLGRTPALITELVALGVPCVTTVCIMADVAFGGAFSQCTRSCHHGRVGCTSASASRGVPLRKSVSFGGCDTFGTRSVETSAIVRGAAGAVCACAGSPAVRDAASAASTKAIRTD